MSEKPMKKRVRASRVIPWPVPYGEQSFNVALVLLTHEELQRAQIAAIEHIRSLRQDAASLAVLQASSFVEIETEVQVLALALREAEQPDMPYKTALELREEMTLVEREALMRAYNAFEQDRSPFSRERDPQKIVAQIHESKTRGVLSDLVNFYDTFSLRSTLLALAEALPTPTNESSPST